MPVDTWSPNNPSHLMSCSNFQCQITSCNLLAVECKKESICLWIVWRRAGLKPNPIRRSAGNGYISSLTLILPSASLTAFVMGAHMGGLWDCNHSNLAPTLTNMSGCPGSVTFKIITFIQPPKVKYQFPKAISYGYLCRETIPMIKINDTAR